MNARKSIVVDKYGLEVAVVKKQFEFERRKRQSLAWSTLLAHMGGFAAMAAGGSMQQMEIFRTQPIFTFLPVIITPCVLLVLFQGSRIMRAQMREEARLAG